MTESGCPICGRPEGGGHEPRCGATPPESDADWLRRHGWEPLTQATPAPKSSRWQFLVNLLHWGLDAGRGPKHEHPLFLFLRLGPFEVRFMRRRS